MTTSCDDNQANPETAFSGGAKLVSGDLRNLNMHGSYPSGVHQVPGGNVNDESGLWEADSWTVVVGNSGNGPIVVQPYVICAAVK